MLLRWGLAEAADPEEQLPGAHVQAVGLWSPFPLAVTGTWWASVRQAACPQDLAADFRQSEQSKVTHRLAAAAPRSVLPEPQS